MKKEVFYLLALSAASLVAFILLVLCTYLIVKDAKSSLSSDIKLINQNQMTMNQKLDNIAGILEDLTFESETCEE